MSRVDISVDMVACQDHGQCVIVAPEAFRFNAQGNLEYETSISDPSDDLLDRIDEAADICPLQAILATRVS